MPTSKLLVRAAAVLGLALTVATFAAPSFAQDPQPATPASIDPAAPSSDATAPADAATGETAGASIVGTPAEADAPPPAAGEPPADTRALDETVQGLKKDVVDLNKELFVLEEELLFPANTQVAVFISMDIGEFFALDSLSLKIDNKEVANYLYTPREAEALLKGGVHRVYLGNLKVGEHQLVAFFSGKGPNERDYKRGANLKFEKGVGAKYLELKITDRQRKAQPEFAIKDWE
ncbi:MAG: AraC family transcriptional regulator [Pseudomonadota bacterium]